MSVLSLFFKKAEKNKNESQSFNLPTVQHMTVGSNDIASDTLDPQEIIDPLWWSISIYDGPEKYYTDLEKFSAPQKYVFAIQWYIAEVNNGGHDQFFYNSTGIVWQEALQGLKEIGHSEAYGILQKAVDIMGGNPSLQHEERQNLMEELDTNFDDLDDAFYNIDDLEDKIVAYIKRNEESFYFDGDVIIP